MDPEFAHPPVHPPIHPRANHIRPIVVRHHAMAMQKAVVFAACAAPVPVANIAVFHLAESAFAANDMSHLGGWTVAPVARFSRPNMQVKAVPPLSNRLGSPFGRPTRLAL